MLPRHCWFIVAAIMFTACRPPPPASELQAAEGDARRGRIAMQEHDCGVCHVIPGVTGARGRVGPPLRHFSRNVYVAGKFPNQPAVLSAWLLDPPAMAPQTAMPAAGLTEREARDMAAYLYTLQ